VKQKIQHSKENNDVNPNETQKAIFHKEKLDSETKFQSNSLKKILCYKYQIPPKNPFQKTMELQENPINLS
jgi:hypothetical protein